MQTAEPRSHQTRREGIEGLADAEVALFVAIDGRHGHFADAGASIVHLYEHGTLEEIAVCNTAEIHLPQRVGTNGEESIDGVADVPIATGGLHHETYAHIANAPDGWHTTQHAAVEQTVAFGKVSLPKSIDQRGDERSVHLTVAIELDYHVGPQFHGLAESCLHSTSDTLVARMMQCDDASAVGHPVNQGWCAVG